MTTTTETTIAHKRIQVLKKSALVTGRLRFEGKPMSFKNYSLSRDIIDSNAENVLFKGGRQVSKSFNLRNHILASIMARSYTHILYIAPRWDQASAFSKDKIKACIDESPAFKKWYIDKNCYDNVKHKSYINGSNFYSRAASQMDTLRGLSVNKLVVDELQDIIMDFLPIIAETMSGRSHNSLWYAGTPKSIHNPMEVQWRKSSQNVPVMVCDSGHYNIPGLKNISERGVICSKCKSLIDVTKTFYKRMGDKDSDLAGFWMPQIVLPLHANDPAKWRKLYLKYQNLDPDQFLNEVMGISAGEGQFLINKKHLMRACRSPESFDMWTAFQPTYLHGIRELVGGIDWGVTGTKSYTVLTIGGMDYDTGRFTIVFQKKWLERDNVKVANEIAEWMENFGLAWVAADWGSGQFANQYLGTITNIPVFPIMYTGDRFRIIYDEKAEFYKASRTLTLIDFFQLIRSNRIRIFSWEEFKHLAPMYLAEFSETSTDAKGNTVVKFDHSETEPDDALHSGNIMIALWKALNPEQAAYYLPG